MHTGLSKSMVTWDISSIVFMKNGIFLCFTLSSYLVINRSYYHIKSGLNIISAGVFEEGRRKENEYLSNNGANRWPRTSIGSRLALAGRKGESWKFVLIWKQETPAGWKVVSIIKINLRRWITFIEQLESKPMGGLLECRGVAVQVLAYFDVS